MSVALDLEPLFRPGKPVVLFEGHFHLPTAGFAQYDVTSEGDRFVMIQGVESWPTQIHVVLNWFEELKARVPTKTR